MIVDISKEWLKELKPQAKGIQDVLNQNYSAKRHMIDLRMFSPDELAKLEAMNKAKKGVGWRVMAQSIETFRLMLAAPTGAPVAHISQLLMMLVAHFEANAPHKWVFTVQGNKRVPYFVRNMAFTPRKKIVHRKTKDEEGWTEVIPAYVQMFLQAAHGESTTVTFREEDCDGKRTVPKLLNSRGMITESPALMERYEAEVSLWRKVTNDPGQQFLASGTAHTLSNSWYSTDEMEMEREGERARVVIDDGSETDEDGRRRNRSKRNTSATTMGNAEFWNKNKEMNHRAVGKPFVIEKVSNDDDMAELPDDEDDDGSEVTSHDDDIVALPIHPWVIIFDLELHQHAQIHIGDLEPYPYNDKLIDKLILPEDTAELIDALVVNADDVMEDIIKGKTGGTIVISTGEPGTGKTLTAEVMSEVAQRPLYRVDCSQLGTKVEEIERELGIVLKRAARWGAVLLIDEADVYIRARGDDIHQNAIVGVFLRLLEYYHGILFMTSNRAVTIDDAILQRATAWVRYTVPTKDEKVKIWNILSENYKTPLGADLINQLAERWPLATGRNIKMMLKLAGTIKKNNPDREGLDLFEMAAKFLDVKDEKLTKRKERANNDIDGRAA